MQLQDKYRVALLAAYALALHGFEALIPSPFPWLRIGLANIITLAALMLYGFRVALMITFIRVLLSSIFIGTFLGPSFFLSLGGGLSSVIAMGCALRLFGSLFGPIGLSIIGAFFHNMAQLGVAFVLIVQRFDAILFIAPVILLIGTLTGLFNGIVADLLMKNILKKDEPTLQNVT